METADLKQRITQGENTTDRIQRELRSVKLLKQLLRLRIPTEVLF